MVYHVPMATVSVSLLKASGGSGGFDWFDGFVFTIPIEVSFRHFDSSSARLGKTNQTNQTHHPLRSGIADLRNHPVKHWSRNLF